MATLTAILATKEFWIVLSGIITLLASAYAAYLSKKAREAAAQAQIYANAPKLETNQQVAAEDKTKIVNQQIAAQKKTEAEFFK